MNKRRMFEDRVLEALLHLQEADEGQTPGEYAEAQLGDDPGPAALAEFNRELLDKVSDAINSTVKALIDPQWKRLYINTGRPWLATNAENTKWRRHIKQVAVNIGPTIDNNKKSN